MAKSLNTPLGAENAEQVPATVPALDTKPESGTATPAQKKEEHEADAKIDGVVGQLEVYKSGAVKMRIGNDIVLDVSVLLRCHARYN